MQGIRNFRYDLTSARGTLIARSGRTSELAGQTEATSRSRGTLDRFRKR